MAQKRILLADDDSDDKAIFLEAISELGEDAFLVSTAENGHEALEMLDNITADDDLPALVILDQNMPRMTGKETLAQLKQAPRFKHIPVIIYSTYNNTRFIDECRQLGAAAIISKPDSYDDYKKMIQLFFDGLIKWRITQGVIIVQSTPANCK